jgi:uncharacterized protein (DUF2461 family)
VSSKEIEVAAGVYMPGPDQLRVLREHIAENHQELRKIIAARPLKRLMGELWGERLARVPKEYGPDHPAADLLRYKQWVFYTVLKPELALGPDLLKEVLMRFRALTPFNDFFNRPLVGRLSKSRAASMLV